MNSAAPALNPDLQALDRVEDYVAWMEGQACRYEVIEGRLTMMPGGTRLHSRLAVRVGSSLERQLQGGACEAFNGDFLLDLGPTKRFYPDAMVVCGETRNWTDRPALVVEVLSETTASYDLGPKLRAYLALPDLLYVVYLWQDRPLARRWTIPSARPSDFAGIGSVVPLPKLGLELSVGELYAGLHPN